jgi:ribosomal protein S18 acetylase RimI-like enzyme
MSGARYDRVTPAVTPSARGDMVLRTGTSADAAAAAALHASQIDEGFLASLGPRFLGRLYRRVPRVPGSFLLVLETEGRAVGFLAGSVHVRALYKEFLVRDGARAVFDCAGHLVRSPRHVFETLRHGTSSERGEAELLAVAVDPEMRGLGGGNTLVEGFLTEVARRGRATADVVVAAGNIPAIALYRRKGFVVVESFELHRGSESLLMRHSGPAPEEPSR